ncbi:MAG TPA: DUF2911 domain-containing protein [Pyrinomonadaceae bacterium]|jgi:hypothetical protein|nr:DUF2911 domain-containing protein [Pyrinomonadaceae bacterium]
MKTRTFLPLLLLLSCACASQAQNSAATPATSPASGAATPQAQKAAPERADAAATVKGKKISINYGRPAMKGRDLLAQAPVGTVWRVGMNQATEITTEADLSVGGKELKAGKYSLWVRRTGEDAWTLAFHPKTGVWGAPALKEGYVAELPLKLEKATDSAEMLTIDLSDANGDGEVKIHWGTTLMSGKFGVK